MGPSYGGPFESVRRLAQEQIAQGWRVEVCMPWSTEAVAHRDQWLPVDCQISGHQSIKSLGWSSSLARELPNHACNILHTHGLWAHASWVALAWKRRSGRPHVASVRGMLEPWAWRHHAWKKRPLWWLIERRNLITAALLHATSEQEAISLRQRNLKSPIAIIPNGVDIPNLPDPTSKSGHRTALFLSRLHPKKGLPMLIEAWARIRPKGWRLQIAGPDEANHRSALESLVRQAGLDTEIHFLGPLAGEAKTLAFIESDLFILPTHSENFGMAIAEALAHALPVITTQGAPWSLLQTEHCGWWTPTNVDGLTSALQEATCMNRDQLTQMGQLGRILMRDRFGWPTVARQMLDCYQWLREDGTRPSCVTVY